MIKLPKEVVEGLAQELNQLVNEENVVTPEQRESIIAENNNLEKLIEEKREAIRCLENEILNLEQDIKEVPEVTEVDQNRVDDLIQILILSGYYRKVTDENGDTYLEETGEYEETPKMEELEMVSLIEEKEDLKEDLKEEFVIEDIKNTEEV